MTPKFPPPRIQYWAWAATVGVALAYAQDFNVRYRIYKERHGYNKGMWIADIIRSRR